VAQKGVVPQTINYPAHQQILRQIRTNQKAFQKEQMQRKFWRQLEQIKGLTRRIVGKQSWHRLRNVYRFIKR
jgi:hypothetical protein